MCHVVSMSTPLEINRRLHSHSVDSNALLRPVSISQRRRAVSTFVPVTSLHLKPQYDANAQIIRQRVFSVSDEQIRESIRESLEELRLSDLHNPLSGVEDRLESSDSDRVAIVAIEEPERPSILSEKYDSWSFYQKAILQCVAMAIFVFLTWGLGFRGDSLGANLAAASTTTVASVLIPDMVIFASIGAYAGMTDLTSVYPVFLLAFLTCISGLCFEKFALFAGKGGRLGTCAFLASVLALAITHKTQPDVVSRERFYDPESVSYSSIDGTLVLNVLVSNVLGVTLTYLLRCLRPLLSPVVAGNAVSMLLIIMVDSFLQHSLDLKERTEAAGCILQGSFVGMSSLLVLFNFGAVLTSGVLSGLVTLLCYPLFPHGVGGKRGFMGFVAVHLFVGLCEVYKLLLPAKYKPVSSDGSKEALLSTVH